jgi:leucyl aminopeptidase
MDFSAKSFNFTKQNSDCLVVGVYKEKKPTLTDTGKSIDKATGMQLSNLLSQGDIKGKAGATLMFYNPNHIKARRILLLGLGKKQDISDAVFRNAIESAIKCLNNCNIRAADFTLLDVFRSPAQITRQARNIVESAEAALYRYDETKSGRKIPIALKKVSLITAGNQLVKARLGIKQGKAIANGVSYTRTISNLPGNICTPSYLARQAQALQKSHNIKTSVLNEAQMKRKKMGSLLSVSSGSREPAKLIVMEYKGGKRGDKPVVLVGKGLTFDAGGISIKPAAAMDEMKYDMCGGASVFGVIRAVAEMQLKLNVVGIVPSSENLPDGAANKPGDIVTSMSGKTIEILNTDAEGRLILCDALTYAEGFKPAAVIDIATLTGACVVALGHHASGLFSNNDKLANELINAGETSGDRVWQMPLWDDYTRQLKSNFADLANIGGRRAAP